MAESAQVRNLRAQRQMRDLGLDPGPLKGAYNRLRKAKGVARGLTASQAVGKPRVGERSVTGVVHAPSTRPAMRRGRQPVRDVTFAHGKGRIVQSVDKRHIRAELQRAAARGEKVSLRITADEGRGPRTRVIEGTPDQRAHIAGRVEGAGDRQADRPDVHLVGKPQITISSDPQVFDVGQGLDPGDLLDFLDDYEDFWDAWADLWAVMYDMYGGE